MVPFFISRRIMVMCLVVWWTECFFNMASCLGVNFVLGFGFFTAFPSACCCGPLHSFWSGLLLRLRLRNLRRNFLRAAGRIRPFRFAFSRFSATSLACLDVGPFFAKPFAKTALTLFCYCHVSLPYCCHPTSHRLWICTIWTPKRLRTRRGRP